MASNNRGAKAGVGTGLSSRLSSVGGYPHAPGVGGARSPVPDLHEQVFVPEESPRLDAPPLGTGVHRVVDGVLHQRLHDERRHRDVQCLRVDVQDRGEAAAEAQRLHVDEAAREAPLVVECDQLVTGVETIPQEGPQAFQGPLGRG